MAIQPRTLGKSGISELAEDGLGLLDQGINTFWDAKSASDARGAAEMKRINAQQIQKELMQRAQAGDYDAQEKLRQQQEAQIQQMNQASMSGFEGTQPIYAGEPSMIQNGGSMPFKMFTQDEQDDAADRHRKRRGQMAWDRAANPPPTEMSKTLENYDTKPNALAPMVKEAYDGGVIPADAGAETQLIGSTKKYNGQGYSRNVQKPTANSYTDKATQAVQGGNKRGYAAVARDHDAQGNEIVIPGTNAERGAQYADAQFAPAWKHPYDAPERQPFDPIENKYDGLMRENNRIRYNAAAANVRGSSPQTLAWNQAEKDKRKIAGVYGSRQASPEWASNMTPAQLQNHYKVRGRDAEFYDQTARGYDKPFSRANMTDYEKSEMERMGRQSEIPNSPSTSPFGPTPTPPPRKSKAEFQSQYVGKDLMANARDMRGSMYKSNIPNTDGSDRMVPNQSSKQLDREALRGNWTADPNNKGGGYNPQNFTGRTVKAPPSTAPQSETKPRPYNPRFM